MKVSFDEFVLDRTTRQLLCAGTEKHLEPKAFELLELLVARRPQAVAKAEIHQFLWPDTFVSESSLTGLVAQLRHALGDDRRQPRFIRTVHGFGYAFSDATASSVIDAHVDTETPASKRTGPPAGNEGTVTAAVKGARNQGNRRRRLVLLGWGGAAAGALALLAFTVRLLSGRLADGRRETTPAPMLRLTDDAGLTMQPTLSADAEILAYASDRSGDGNLDIWVQRVRGGDPVRLTSDPMDDEEPSLSPDGTRVAFHSARDHGGVYVMPARAGSAATLLAPGGTFPRYSPDGRWIAYTIGFHPREGGDAEAPGLNSIHVLPASGGAPRRIVPDFVSAFAAVWSPDGARLFFRGKRRADEPSDWWVVPVDGGPAVRTGAQDILARRTIAGHWNAGAWLDGNRILIVGRGGDADDVWVLRLSADTFQAQDDLRRLTTGVGYNLNPFAAGNFLVFGGHTFGFDVWSLPVDADAGTVTGALRQLTQPPVLKTSPSVSSDGRIITYWTLQSGGGDLRMKDLGTGTETVLLPKGRATTYVLHPDGGRVAFRDLAAGAPFTEVISTSGRGTPERLCSGCGRWNLWDWSRDGRWLLDVSGLASDADPAAVAAIDLVSGKTIQILRDERHNLYQARLSSDARWVLFMEAISLRASRLWVAPFRWGPVPRPEWVALTSGESYEDKPRWSPNGGIVYFVSNRDGHRCIWAQRLDPASKRPVGMPFVMHHAHKARLSIGNMPMSAQATSVARDRIIFNMGEVTANIWSIALDTARH